jgi:hypothetical protein
VVMVAMGVAGGTIRSMSIIALKTISRRTITIILRNTRINRAARVRIGSITRNTARAPSIRTRTQPRNTGSSVPGPEPELLQPTPGVMAKVQVGKVAENHKPVTSVVVQATKPVESLKPAMPVEEGGKRALWVDLARAVANVLPVIRARGAGALRRAALEVQVGRRAGAAVHRAAVEEDPLEVAEEEAGAEVGEL